MSVKIRWASRVKVGKREMRGYGHCEEVRFVEMSDLSVKSQLALTPNCCIHHKAEGACPNGLRLAMTRFGLSCMRVELFEGKSAVTSV